MGDGAKILDQVGVRHTHAGVGDGDGAGLVIGFDGDARLDFRLVNGLARALQEAQLLARVRRVGNQFADEDFAVGVDGMDDDIQQLLDLRLKMMFFGSTHSDKYWTTSIAELLRRQEGD